MKPKHYLVYALSHPLTGEVRYIGKSESGLQRPRQHGHLTHLTRQAHLPSVRWIKKLRAAGLDYQIEVVEEFPDRPSLMEGEKFYISYFRSLGFRLLNICDGGEGRTGPMSPEARAKMRASRSTLEARAENSKKLRELWKTPEYVQSVRDGHRARRAAGFKPNWSGRKHSDVTRAKMSSTKKGRPLTPSQAAALRKVQQDNIGRKGPVRSVEWREKLGRAWRGKPGPNTGKKFSDAARLANSRARGGTAIRDSNGAVYPTIHEAARQLGIPATKICAVLKGRRNSAGGLRFSRTEK